jgi:putative acetyltransferase
MNIAFESPDQPDVVALITELDRYQSALYPPESNHFVDIATLTQPNVLFAVARGSDGAAGACGAIVLGPHYGEIKRMYVHPRLRGQGVAKALLAFLEAAARERGCSLLQLETGILQDEAIGLYKRCGYEKRGPFGDYKEDPLSLFMAKRIA